ncbi:nodulation-signaling pathway 2 protein-like [Pyrus ussuriensis x Pyrus communis]|uniref:Nodulation-signaling pathway 2 protein-like n=1 Tax=Pyrus ussuriensis x Pyrus communis TaxID=2448454 RepID=A0A5N5F519_9ROSA|nr:nodulation-signaling pathway 2 protein-like [Pyrus ussuriensis x Pyrus communis]
MDFELIDDPFDFKLGYIDELHDQYQCSFGTTSATTFQTSPETSDSLVPFAVHEDLHHLDQPLSELLQIEAKLMDVEHINQNHIIGLESASYINEGTEQNAHVLTRRNQIQVELLEESSLTELLFTGADAVEAKDRPLALYIISKLKTVVLMDTKENEDNLFNRLALFFTQGLYSKSLNFLDRWQTFQMLQELSPYLIFAHFMANQAILEAMRGVNEIHVIDLDIMEGSQWPSLMVDLAMKGGPAASIRVTAFTVDDQQTVHQARIRLK